MNEELANHSKELKGMLEVDIKETLASLCDHLRFVLPDLPLREDITIFDFQTVMEKLQRDVMVLNARKSEMSDKAKDLQEQMKDLKSGFMQ